MVSDVELGCSDCGSKNVWIKGKEFVCGACNGIFTYEARGSEQ